MCQLPENPLLAVGLRGCFGGVVPKLGDAELGDISESWSTESQSEEPLLLRNGKQIMVTCVWKTWETSA